MIWNPVFIMEFYVGESKQMQKTALSSFLKNKSTNSNKTLKSYQVCYRNYVNVGIIRGSKPRIYWDK